LARAIRRNKRSASTSSASVVSAPRCS
jgi:hypothetical protein